MTQDNFLTETKQKYELAYRKRTVKSLEANEKAKKYMPGGATRATLFFSPYPLWIEKGEGSKLTDLDGNSYIDFHNNFTTLALGHSNPYIMKAVREQLAKGTIHTGLHPAVIHWAEMICERVNSIESLRFAASGTEAIMAGIKACRAFTGKDKIVKIEYGFNGDYDPVVNPSNAPGLSHSILADSITIPFNDKEAAEKAIVENRDELAVVVVEGMLGKTGQIPPLDDYLIHLRKITESNNVLLFLDEIQCFRIDFGGVQRIFGIKPDLTALGKLIGGGFPVGAFGGNKDIMNLFFPETEKIFHSGTFTANPVTAVAGVATLEQFTTEEIARINRLGESLADGIRKAFKRLNIRGQVTGRGSLQNIHFSIMPVNNGKVSEAGRKVYKDVLHLLHLALLERGIFSSEKGLFNTSTPMTDKEVTLAINGVNDSLTELSPYIAQAHPELTK